MPFEPPADWTRVTALDAHAAGEPLRVITGGFPEPAGDTMLAKRRHAREHLDALRRAVMLEPRGHADMYGALPTRPVTPDGHVGVLFLHNEGWSTMCGHGVVGLVTAGLEAGLFAADADGEVRLDTPAGRVTARAELAGGRVRSVAFRNVPSFAVARDLAVDVPGLGRLVVDLAFGGAFYAVADAAAAGVALAPEHGARIAEAGMRIKGALADRPEIAHPAAPPGGGRELDFLYGAILVEPRGGDVHSRNACVFADGELDRSPTGTGVSARAALLHARGELAVGETIAIESVIGTRFEVRVVEETRAGALAAVVPEVRGSAWLTGRNELWIDPADPLRAGFRVR